MTTKTIKTILFASLIAAMILPFSGMMMAEAAQDENANKAKDKHNGKSLIKTAKSDKDIPLQKSETEITQWYTDNSNPVKEKLAREKQDILIDSIIAEEKLLGTENLRKQLPWTTIGYDYVDNALEVTIVPSEFTKDKIPKYMEKIRSIVGSEVDVTLSPQGYATPEACSSRTSGECQPIKGGVEVQFDNSSNCTVGFKASYNGYTGFVTAGHCVDGMSSVKVEQSGSSSTDIGNVIKEMWYNNSACDCAFISETVSTRSMDDGIYGLSDPNTTANPFVGMTVKMSGKNSGIESGTVIDTSETVYYPGNTIKYLVVADYDSVGGDSGAPIVSGSSLVGIHSGSDQAGTDAYFTKHSKFTTYFSGLSWGF